MAQTKASQTLNPEASLNTDPVTGLDGQSATNAINSYEQSFKSQASPSDGSGRRRKRQFDVRERHGWGPGQRVWLAVMRAVIDG